MKVVVELMFVYFKNQTHDTAFYVSLNIAVEDWSIVFFSDQLPRFINSEYGLPKDHCIAGLLIRFILISTFILSEFFVNKPQ